MKRFIPGWYTLARRFTLALIGAFLSLPAGAQSSAPTKNEEVKLEDMLRPPALSSPIFSKSGKYFAATAPSPSTKRMNLVVVDMATRKGEIITGFKDFDVIDVHWVGDERLVFSLGQLNSPTGVGRYAGGGLFVVSRDGKENKSLAPTVQESKNRNQVHRSLTHFRTIPDNTEEIIASGNMTHAESIDLYRLNLRTGKYALVTGGRPASYTQSWLLDTKLVPRVVTAWVKDSFTFVVYYRAGEDAPWTEIGRYDMNKPPIFHPLAIESDGKTLQVATNAGRDTMAVYRFDPESKKLGEMIAQHPRYDMGANAGGSPVSGVSVDPLTNKVLGFRVAAAKPEVAWVDPDYAKIQRMLDAALPGLINSFYRAPGTSKRVVTSYSDRSPTRWYILDEEKKTIEEIGSSRPWLDGKLVEQRPFLFKTRDGLEIPGYYFLPKNYQPGTKLPTIMHIHGGPHARADHWGRGFGYMEAQLFASRGYAVVVPNFRITPGMGSKVYFSGFGTFGRQMSEDHEDALKWAVEQGFADPQRACISGASYGGYAALQAMIKTPKLFKCAISGLAPTDLEYQLTTFDGDTATHEVGVKLWKGILGTEDLSSQLVKDISPVYNADKIKGAVFLYAGEDDLRVPIRQITRMNDALEKAGNPAKAYVVKKEEGHGFGKLENNLDLYTQVLKFLEEQIGKP
ncbi:MAG: S9 family peptidase [Betaproteobacteria bacterium]|nr:S9 family peptidase [Betaproteobacteria bacterium]